MDESILYDGECNLCNGFINFVMKRDNHHLFRYIPLQSSEGENLLSERGIAIAITPETIVLVNINTIYTQSTAVLKILQKIGLPWSISYVLIFIPKPLRDLCYNIIAKYRYRLFGKSSSCKLPTDN